MNDESHAVTGRGMKLSVAAMVAALASLLAFAPLASAASDPLASGTTTVKLNNGLYKKLKTNGVKVLGVKPATANKQTVKLPVSGGELDPLSAQGTVEHSGGVKFKRGKKSATLKSLVLDTAKRSLTAKLGAKTLKIATLLGMSSKRDGFGVDVSVRKLKLTAKAAKLLNGKLGIKAFKANANLGTSASATQPSTVTVLPTNKAVLTAGLATYTKLAKVLVKISPVAPATEPVPIPPPVYEFPIGGGTIAPNANAGIVQTTGGLRLTQVFVPGSVETTMTLGAIWVDLGAKTATVEVMVESKGIDPKLNLGNLGRSSIADVNLTGATIKSDPTMRTVTVENGLATLQAVTAETLNSVFVTPFEAITKTSAEKFAAGDPLGTFSFTAQTQ